ncbi:MAG: ATP-binding protein [Anaerolineales bacterium]|nr:ATP-binding protein [Anaerolineales bacterium]MCK5314287.1 ATP-binding protein [Anaerolineales bacterium]
MSGVERSAEDKSKIDLITSHDESVEVDLQPAVRSLRELLDRVTGRGFQQPQSSEDSGIAEILPFPFLALVGQYEMKLALMLALINPAAGGVLLIGPRGTGKTTAVRSLVDLLPEVPRSLCYYGCMPEDIESGGIDAVCPDCARKFAEGEPLAKLDHVRLVELPLNARLEDVVGGVDERAAVHSRLRIRRGLLAQADHNLLFVDEINLLSDEVVDALLDAAAQGYYTVRRGAVSASYKSRFVLVGSMNPEEGRLRPQIQDRFGLRVVVRGLEDIQERLEAYRRVQAYQSNPRQTVTRFVTETEIAKAEIQAARDILSNVILSNEVAQSGLELINRLKIDSLRAEITLFEGARAYAAAEGRQEVNLDDLREIAPLALRLRRSNFMEGYLEQQQTEESELLEILNTVIPQ